MDFLLGERKRFLKLTGRGLMIPTIDKYATGVRLKELMEQHNLVARDIQQYLSLGCVQTVYRWFEGVNIPSLDNLYALSGLFGVSMDDMVVGTRPPLNTKANALFKERMLFYCKALSQTKVQRQSIA